MQWMVADVTSWEPSHTYDVWHDRAALHFLTDPKDRAAYVERVIRAVRAGGHVIIGTFAPDGPERCSGLPVVRHDARSLGELLGSSFELAESRRHDHQTPGGAIQKFQFLAVAIRCSPTCSDRPSALANEQTSISTFCFVSMLG